MSAEKINSSAQQMFTECPLLARYGKPCRSAAQRVSNPARLGEPGVSTSTGPQERVTGGFTRSGNSEQEPEATQWLMTRTCLFALMAAKDSMTQPGSGSLEGKGG